MDPATLATISEYASVAGTAATVIGGIQQSNATASANRYAAQVAANNKTIADQYAAQSKQQGEVLAQEKEQETAQREGSIRAATGAAGLDPTGSPLRLVSDTEALGSLDAKTIRANAAKASYGYTSQGLNYGAQAEMDTAAAKNASKAGNLSAFGSIISGTANVSDKWLKYKQVGLIS